jgi:hypothetical protein
MTTLDSPSPYPYPSGTPSSQPFSFTPTPGPLNTPYVSYIAMPSYSSSPLGLPISASYDKKKILSDISDDAFYGIICAIIFVVLYSSIHAIYYYKKYKKEKLRLKRFNELQGKVHTSVLNPAYPA